MGGGIGDFPKIGNLLLFLFAKTEACYSRKK
jgi:hypothetical protein